MGRPRSSVFGIGINDVNYVIRPTISGKQEKCQFYSTWVRMIERCYSEKWQKRNRSYVGCTVCDEWLYFSKFKAWMEKQDWKGKQLDKDLLVFGNKVYSPETCVFISIAANSFMTDCLSSRGDLPIGVSWHKRDRKMQSSCHNPLTNKREFLGYFDCKYKAYKAWRKRKHEIACILSGLESDEKAIKALRTRYL